MQFSELLKERQSVRAYTDKPVEDWKVDLLIEAVRLAPSASNSQPWRLIIVREPEKKNAVASACYSTLVSFNSFAPQAPLIAVLTIERARVVTQIGAALKKRDFPLIDIGIAASHFCLQATELGLGTCMIGWFDEPRVREVLAIPESTRIGLLITLGYGNDEPRRKVRKSREEMSSFDTYRS